MMKSLHKIRTAMRNCQQTPSQNMLQHGISVARYYTELSKHRYTPTKLISWKLPDWIFSKTLWDNVFNDSIMLTYLIYHDLGKPFCHTIDSAGKHHFPNHASVSKSVWNSINGSQIVGNLIGMDMDIHTLSDCDLVSFANRPEAASLLIAGLCELHSNANMFGGIDSVSFKIKYKHLNRRGKKIVALLESQPPKTR
jgi:hypothetical protein